MCVIWLIHVCDLTHPRAWHDSFMRVTSLTHLRHMTHLCMWHTSYIRGNIRYTHVERRVILYDVPMWVCASCQIYKIMNGLRGTLRRTWVCHITYGSNGMSCTHMWNDTPLNLYVTWRINVLHDMPLNPYVTWRIHMWHDTPLNLYVTWRIHVLHDMPLNPYVTRHTHMWHDTPLNLYVTRRNVFTCDMTCLLIQKWHDVVMCDMTCLSIYMWYNVFTCDMTCLLIHMWHEVPMCEMPLAQIEMLQRQLQEVTQTKDQVIDRQKVNLSKYIYTYKSVYM